MDMDTPLVVEGSWFEAQQESQEGQGEREERGQGVEEDILASRELPQGRSTTCWNPLEKTQCNSWAAAYVTGPWESPWLFKGILNETDPQMT